MLYFIYKLTKSKRNNMIRMKLAQLKSFIPIRALGLKQFRKHANGSNCEEAMKCLVNYDIKGFQDAVKKAVAAGEDINKVTSNGETFFTFAAKIHSIHAVNALVEAVGFNAINFNAPNIYGETFKVIIENDNQEILTADKKEVEQNSVEVQEQEVEQNSVEVQEQEVVVEKELIIEVPQKEVSQDIAQEVQIEDVAQKSASFIVALFNQLAALNDQPPVFNDGTEDVISVAEEILPMSGQVDMVGDQGAHISEHPAETLYEKSMISGSNF